MIRIARLCTPQAVALIVCGPALSTAGQQWTVMTISAPVLDV